MAAGDARGRRQTSACIHAELARGAAARCRRLLGLAPAGVKEEGKPRGAQAAHEGQVGAAALLLKRGVQAARPWHRQTRMGL